MDDDLCTAGYPEAGPDVGLLCNLLAGHPGDHRALAEVAFNYRRHVTWPQDGTVIVLSQAEFEAAARRALADLGLTYEQLAEQARRGDFGSSQAHALWVSIGGTVNL